MNDFFDKDTPVYTEREFEETLEESLEECRKNNAYTDFMQLNKAHISDLNRLIGLSPMAARIFMFIMDNMNKANALVCSSTVLAEALDCSISAITKSLKILRDNGFIEIAKSGHTNVFYLNAEIAWQSYGKNKKYAEFCNAKVIFAETEQCEKYVKKIKAPTVNVAAPRS